ncbi:hypothetical protein BGZ89_006209 [Linnemannia elongata]|nr:hypothetical protein BGZ89_006209 [Linnemannia elongata]
MTQAHTTPSSPMVAHTCLSQCQEQPLPWKPLQFFSIISPFTTQLDKSEIARAVLRRHLRHSIKPESPKRATSAQVHRHPRSSVALSEDKPKTPFTFLEGCVWPLHISYSTAPT